MENKKEVSTQDKARIESLLTMSIANTCYGKLEDNNDFELIPIYCSMFVSNSQKGEIALLQAYNVSRQLGRPTSVTALINILFQNNCISYYDKTDSKVSRNVIGYSGKLSLKEITSDEKIEFNVLILTKKTGNGIEVVKLQVYDKPLELTKEKGLDVTLPCCHNIFVDEEIRNSTRDEIMNAARLAVEKIDEEIKNKEEAEETPESE